MVPQNSPAYTRRWLICSSPSSCSPLQSPQHSSITCSPPKLSGYAFSAPWSEWIWFTLPPKPLPLPSFPTSDKVETVRPIAAALACLPWTSLIPSVTGLTTRLLILHLHPSVTRSRRLSLAYRMLQRPPCWSPAGSPAGPACRPPSPHGVISLSAVGLAVLSYCFSLQV